jgi:hypothetical protein
MEAYWGMEIKSTHSLTSALDGAEWSASRPGRFTPRERVPSTHWIGGWVGPRAVLDADEFPNSASGKLDESDWLRQDYEILSTLPRPYCTHRPKHNHLPIQWVPGALFLGVKRQGREADYSPPSIVKVKECMELYLYSPNTPSWRGAQLKEAQGQLCLYLYRSSWW